MDFLSKLKQCKSIYDFFELVNFENHDEILKHLDEILKKFQGRDFFDLMSKFNKCNLFTDSELKEIFLSSIEYYSQNLVDMSPIVELYGKKFTFNKIDLKRFYKAIAFSLTMHKLYNFLEKVRQARRKMWGLNGDSLKEVQVELLNLYSEFLKEYRFEPKEKEMLDIINTLTFDDVIIKIFVNMPFNHMFPQIESEIERLVDQEYEDNMQYKGSGSFSFVFGNNDKVVKFSVRGEKYTTIDCDQILGFESTNFIDLYGIKLSTGTQKNANTDWYNGFEFNEIDSKMYDVFCKAMDSGYVICDLRKENFGEVSGELKLVDTGFVYKVNEFDINKVSEATFIGTLKRFIKLYNEGYRVVSKLEEPLAKSS